MSTLLSTNTHEQSPTQSPINGKAPHKQTVWRRKNMDERRAAANKSAQELIWLADNSEYWQDPENKELLRDLYRLADKVRKDAAPVSDESVKEILRALKYEYCQTTADLRQHVYMTK